MSGGPIYMLDTNIAGYIASGRSQVARIKLREALADGAVLISTITEAEILFGLARRPEAVRLRTSVRALLDTLQIRPWDSAAANAYGILRIALHRTGKSLSLMDLLIASHAASTDATLVSHDQAFVHVTPFVTVTDWATDL